MADFDHGSLPLGQRHAPHNFEYADAAARTAATGMVPGDVTKWAKQLDDGTFWELTDDSPVTWAQRTGTGGGGTVDSVNGQTGTVVLDADDIGDSGTTNQFATAAELSKLAAIEALADVTDATNVAAAGAVMEADASTALMGFVLDEDDMASDSATKLPTQQSVKAFVMAMVTGLIDFKDSVRVATAAALPSNSRTGNVITASGNGALAAVDGVTLIAGDRLLVKNEATGANNGLYVVTTIGDASNPFVLTRAADANASGEVTGGLYVFATEGTANGERGFILTTNDPITLNTTALSFALFGVTGSVSGLDDLSDVDTTAITPLDNDVLTYYGPGGVWRPEPRWTITAKVGPSATFDGGGAALSTAVASPITRVPYATTLTGWSIDADASGSAVVDVQRATAAAPSTFSSIAGTAKPTLSSAQSADDTTLTGWGDATLDEGDRLRFVLSSVSGGIEWLGVFLHATRAL